MTTTSPRPIRPWLVALLRPIHSAFIRSYFRVTVRGRENLPASGAVILAPTHRSRWDSLLLPEVARRPLAFLANRDDFVGVQGWFMARLGAIPVNTAWPGPGALRRCRDELLAGRPLVIYPEGTVFYSPPGEVHPLKPGLAWLALGCQGDRPDLALKVVPVRIRYADRYPGFRGRVEVVVGEPIDVAAYLDAPGAAGRDRLKADLTRALGDTVNESVADRDPGYRPFGSGAATPDSLPEGRPARARLDPATRAGIRDLHRLRPAWNLVILAYLAIWIVAAVAVARADAWPARLACYLAIGTSIHALATLMHEGIHGTLFRRRRLDRWVGFLLGAPALFSITAYRVAHLAHHRHTRTDRDPDEFTNLSGGRPVQALVFYAWIAVGMLAYLVHVPTGAWRLARPGERRAILLEYGLIAAMIGAAAGFAASRGRIDLFGHCWAYPLAVAILLGNVRSWAEHALTIPGDPLTQTRTVVSNRVVSFLMCNLNYHLEHHLYPGVPWYNLPRVHALMRDEYRRAGAFVHRSYLRYLLAAAVAGVHGRVPGRLLAED